MRRSLLEEIAVTLLLPTLRSGALSVDSEIEVDEEREDNQEEEEVEEKEEEDNDGGGTKEEKGEEDEEEEGGGGDVKEDKAGTGRKQEDNNDGEEEDTQTNGHGEDADVEEKHAAGSSDGTVPESMGPQKINHSPLLHHAAFCRLPALTAALLTEGADISNKVCELLCATTVMCVSDRGCFSRTHHLLCIGMFM